MNDIFTQLGRLDEQRFGKQISLCWNLPLVLAIIIAGYATQGHKCGKTKECNYWILYGKTVRRPSKSMLVLMPPTEHDMIHKYVIYNKNKKLIHESEYGDGGVEEIQCSWTSPIGRRCSHTIETGYLLCIYHLALK